MNTKSIAPIITTSKLRETRAFYVGLLGFEPTFEHDCYLGLRGGPPGSPELGFMTPDAESPHEFGGRGVTFGIRVDDADREFARLERAGVPILQRPMDRPWGARSFVIADPNGVAIYVSHPIPAAPEFEACKR